MWNVFDDRLNISPVHFSRQSPAIAIFAVFDRSKYTGLPQRNPLSKLRETPQGLCTEDHLHTRHTFMQSPALKRSTDEDCAAAGLLDKNVPGQLRNMLGNNIQNMG
jgi:hypothetical protein